MLFLPFKLYVDFVLGILKRNCGKGLQALPEVRRDVAHTENGEEATFSPPAFQPTMHLNVYELECLWGSSSWLH